MWECAIDIIRVVLEPFNLRKIRRSMLSLVMVNQSFLIEGKWKTNKNKTK